MRPLLLATAIGLASLAGLASTPALAQDSDAPQVSENGVTSYPSAYFDEYRPTTAMSMIGNIPGFSFDSGGDARGQSANAGNVLIDGRRPPAGNDGLSSILSRIPASSVERIDVIRGGAAGIDMMGKPMVANVIRKQTASLNGAINAGIDASEAGNISYNTSINAQRRSGERTIDGSLSFNENTNRNEGMSLRVAPDGTILQQGEGISQFSFTGLGANGAIEQPLLGGNFRANAQYRSTNNESQSNSLLLVPAGQREVSAGTGESEAMELGLRYSRTLQSGRKLETVFLQQREESTSASAFSTPGAEQVIGSVQKSGQTVLTGLVTLPQRGSWSYDGGAEVAYNWFEAISVYSQNGAPFAIRGDGQDVSELRTEAFATANWTPSPKLSGQIGVRFERSTLSTDTTAGAEEQTFSYLKPRVNLSWRPAAGHELAVTLQQTVGQLSFNDFAVSSSPVTNVTVVTNPSLEPEQTWSLETRYQRNWGRRGFFSAAYIVRRVDNPLGRTIIRVPAMPATLSSPATPERLFDITANLEPATYHQIRLSTNVPLEPFGLKDSYFSASLNLRDSEVIDPIGGLGRRSSGESPYDWNLGFSQELNNNLFNWRINVSGRPDTEGFGPRSLNYSKGSTSVNASFSWRPTDKLVLSASASGNLGGSESRSIQFTGPRSDNVLRWTTFNQSQNSARASFSLRRAF